MVSNSVHKRPNATTSTPRKWHKLTATKSEWSPSRVVVFHVEPLVRERGNGEYEHVFGHGWTRAVWLAAGKQVEQKDAVILRPEDLWLFLDQVCCNDRSTWIFAHGLGYQLTLLRFWDHLDSSGERYLWGVLSDPPTIICTLRHGRVRKWIDLKNYWPASLAELLTGMLPATLQIAAGPASSPAPAMSSAQKTDLLATLLLGAIATVARERMCAWTYTAASLSWLTYKHSYIGSTIYIHKHERATKLERDSLFGGRLAAYRLGRVAEPVHALDINSLYPYVMVTQPMPCKLISYQEKASVRELHQALRGFVCVAEVAVESPPHPLPRGPRPAVTYSQARGTYILAGRELDEVVENGMVYAVGRLARYRCADLFSRYVADLYPRKLAAKTSGNMAGYQLYKILLNSLSGKFAQQRRRWYEHPDIPARDRWSYYWSVLGDDRRPRRTRSVAGMVQILEEGGEKRDSFAMVTSAITAAGRIALEGDITLAGQREVLYCDTDCIHVTALGAGRLRASGRMDPHALGDLKEVCPPAEAYYWGPKCYRIGDYWVSNIVQLTAKPLADGHFLQFSKRGLEATFERGVRDRVIVKAATVVLNDAPSSGTRNSQTHTRPPA